MGERYDPDGAFVREIDEVVGKPLEIHPPVVAEVPRAIPHRIFEDARHQFVESTSKSAANSSLDQWSAV
ncbi:MAG: hypothetical protein R3F11_12745 [Verrucomicrobiales bacterium]